MCVRLTIYANRQLFFFYLREAVRNADDVIFALLYADNKEEMVSDAAVNATQHLLSIPQGSLFFFISKTPVSL